MAEPIKMPFGVWTRVCPRKYVLDEDTHWRNLANTIASSMCGGDTAFLSNYFDHLFVLLTTLTMAHNHREKYRPDRRIGITRCV